MAMEGTLVLQAGQLRFGVNQKVGRDGQVGRVELAATLLEREVRAVEDDEKVEVAADAPIAASQRAEVADAQDVWVTAGLLVGPGPGRGLDLGGPRPF